MLILRRIMAVSGQGISYMSIGVKTVYDIVDNLAGGVRSLGPHGPVHDWSEINSIPPNSATSPLHTR